jgi:IS30 family transposase
MASGSSIREIARHLDRAASTVSREVARHGGRLAHRAHEADDQAWESALRPKRCLLAVNRKLRNIVASDWEGDLLSGAKNSYIATLVERHSRFALLIKVSSKQELHFQWLGSRTTRADIPGRQII